MTTQPLTTEFAVADADRPIGTALYGRVVFDVFGYVECYVERHDDWTALPVRLVTDQAAGWHLELGPYNLDRADIEVLRRAIAAYDLAVTPRAVEQ